MIALAVGALALASCANRGSDDERQINTALLRTLTQNGTAICVDSQTYGEPLAVFRTMRVAPEPVRRLLRWHPPGPLQPGRLLTGHELVRDELGDGRSTLPEFGQKGDGLPQTTQAQLNTLAHADALVEPQASARLDDTESAPLAKVRWWPLNRLDRSCGPVYTVSKPVIKSGTAFVTVTAAHQGTTYAFQKTKADWAAVAQWSNWLY